MDESRVERPNVLYVPHVPDVGLRTNHDILVTLHDDDRRLQDEALCALTVMIPD